MRARRALLPDAEAIRSLIEEFSSDGTLLPRSLAELCENIRDFVVIESFSAAGPAIIGCGALHLYGTHLAEIRSIAVRPSAQGLGAGRLLVNALFEEADLQRVACVCLFTRIPKFFEHLGFKIAEREKLPDKIYKDCMSCPRLLACDEIAMYRGELPQFAILEPAHADLIKLTL
ncbi:MAG: N-acetyltransferase [Candidatus Korobacteraceae bacterium]|jgi:amino-acid N-acetyltransferase